MISVDGEGYIEYNKSNEKFSNNKHAEGELVVNIGEKIKQLRLENNLTQEELADRCELSKGFISQVERDMTSPSIASLVDILESLGTNLQTFFSETEEEKIVFKHEDFFEKLMKKSGIHLNGLFQMLKRI